MKPPRPTDAGMIPELRRIALDAGQAILRVYATDFEVETKSDASPLTQADKAAHDLIRGGLARAFPDIPVLSEEGELPGYAERRNWDRFFLVDPLDGTREFVARNGEFTVNIALVAQGYPVLGVVHAPVTGRTWWGGLRLGAFRADETGEEQAIRAADWAGAAAHPRVLTSRSHPSPALERFLAALPGAERLTAGSSLKFCLLAEGAAELYPRANYTAEWDTAAGQAVLEGAGGTMLSPEGERFGYNKPSLANDDGFLALCRAGAAEVSGLLRRLRDARRTGG